MDWGIFWGIILEDMPLEHFLAYSALMAAGAGLFFALDVSHAVKRDQCSPGKFSWGFLIRDNILRILGVMLLIMAAVLFFEEFVGVAINAKLAFTQGLSIDALIGTMLKKGKQARPFKKGRDKLIKKYN